MNNDVLIFKVVKFPPVNLYLEANSNGLTRVCFLANIEGKSHKLDVAYEEYDSCPADQPGKEYIRQAEQELSQYFAGERKEFTVKLNLNYYGTEFQQRVWRELINIPYGSTCSYMQVAEKIGLKNGARAVGGANHNNPICIIVPCHRVINSIGRLGGYAGGLAAKEYLLRIEGRDIK